MLNAATHRELAAHCLTLQARLGRLESANRRALNHLGNPHASPINRIRLAALALTDGLNTLNGKAPL